MTKQRELTLTEHEFEIIVNSIDSVVGEFGCIMEPSSKAEHEALHARLVLVQKRLKRRKKPRGLSIKFTCPSCKGAPDVDCICKGP